MKISIELSEIEIEEGKAMLARVRPGVSIEEALQERCRAWLASMQAAYPPPVEARKLVVGPW
jgi:hypothetical protein